MNFLPTHPPLELIAILTAIMLFAYWLVYCMGSPLADDIRDVDIRGILFFFPWWLGRKRMVQWHLHDEALKEWRDEDQITSGSRSKLQAYREWRRRYFSTAREFFTWERSLLCPICLHWWLTVIVVAALFAFRYWHGLDTLLLCGLVYLVNHFFIRKIS
jgi:hypothetical protein